MKGTVSCFSYTPNLMGSPNTGADPHGQMNHLHTGEFLGLFYSKVEYKIFLKLGYQVYSCRV